MPNSRPIRVLPRAALASAGLLVLAFGAVTSAIAALPDEQRASPAPAGVWTKLPTEPYPGKQDDVYFVDARHGWYGNGRGELFYSEDGGDSWSRRWHRPGTFIRALGFIDAENGFLGNIGPGYFPGVSDATLLYRTRDGGRSWEPVTLPQNRLKGICAIDIQRLPSGPDAAPRVLIHAAGRVGGPAGLLRSVDGGEHWQALELPAAAAMVLDVRFLDADTGLVFAATDTDIAKSNALILRSDDGGRHWHEVYRSARHFESIWKAAFPSTQIGYATLQNYDPSTTQRHVVKTSDGGKTWTELPLVDDAAVREFGIGFASTEHGWIGTTVGGFETRDGGRSWQRVEIGKAVNKIRFVADADGLTGWAIGTDLHRWRQPARGD